MPGRDVAPAVAAGSRAAPRRASGTGSRRRARPLRWRPVEDQETATLAVHRGAFRPRGAPPGLGCAWWSFRASARGRPAGCCRCACSRPRSVRSGRAARSGSERSARAAHRPGAARPRTGWKNPSRQNGPRAPVARRRAGWTGGRVPGPWTRVRNGTLAAGSRAASRNTQRPDGGALRGVDAGCGKCTRRGAARRGMP